VKPKELRFAVEVDQAGGMRAEQGPRVETPAEWSAEHLLLAALVRCSLKSLRHSARRIGSKAGGHGLARGRVTRRETDGRYAFVEVSVELDVRVEPPPENPADLVARAERGCFVGSSLTAAPQYRWRVNGAEV
jgi:organic hydroperoxide reductase OsmC/OhrA